MNTKTLNKIFAMILAFTIAFANFGMLGTAIAANVENAELENQNTQVARANVQFDAYFLENGEMKHSEEIKTNEETKTLYISVKVADGYLKDAKVKINDASFKVIAGNETLERIQSIDEETNTITLNQINKEESVVLEIPVRLNTDSNYAIENLDKTAKVELQGTYVNNDGNTKEISKEIEVQVKTIADVELEVEEEITKYVPYEINENKGTIMQTLVKTKIKDNSLPAKSTKLEIEIPKIDNKEPKQITVTSLGTKATNGEDGRTYSEDEYTVENGKLTLIIENNQKENGIVSWEKDATDEILITYIYEESIENTSIDLSAVSTVTLFDGQETTKTINETKEIEGQIGEIVTFGVEANTAELYKGYMQVENAKNTSYTEKITANVGYKDLVEGLEISTETKYLDKNENKFPSEALYTYTKVDKADLINLLGEDGYVSILDKDGNEIAKLNKENTEYKYEQETTNIKIVTSKPIVEGILEIENGREIKSLEYSKAQEKTFTSLETSAKGKAVNQYASLEGTALNKIELKEPMSQAELTLSTSNLSTIATNENVEMRVTLKTTNADTVLYKNPKIEITLPNYITNLYVVDGKVALLYEDELVLVPNADMYRNENGNIVIKVELKGEQTKFNEVAGTQGATLLIRANIDVNSLTPSRTENATLKVNSGNNETKEYETPIKFVAPVGMVTVNGMSGYNGEDTAMSISGQAQTGKLKALESEKNAKVSMTVINNYNYDCTNIKLLGRLPFEGNKDIKTLEDLGSTFTAKLTSDIKAVSGVDSDKVKVYYSSNGEATDDLEKPENGWTEDRKSMEDVKSYLVVLNDFTLKTGETLKFEYDVKVPEKLEYNQKTNSVYAVYYNRASENEEIALASNNIEVVEAPLVGIGTPNIATFSVELTNDGTSPIPQGSTVNYTAKVKNTSEQDATGVVLTVKFSDTATFIQTDDKGFINYISDSEADPAKIQVGDIKAGETKTVTFSMMVRNSLTSATPDYDAMIEELQGILDAMPEDVTREKFLTEDEYNDYITQRNELKQQIENIKASKGTKNPIELTVKAKVTSEGTEDTFESNELKNEIAEMKDGLVLALHSGILAENIEVNNDIIYALDVTSRSLNTPQNVDISVKIPDGLTYKENHMDILKEGASDSVQETGQYDENTKTVTWHIDKLGSYQTIYLKCTTNDLEANSTEKTIDMMFTGKMDGTDETFNSNVYQIKVIKQSLSITQASNVSSQYIRSGDKITYSTVIKNATPDSVEIFFEDYLPDALKFIEGYYTQNGEKKNVQLIANNYLTMNATLSANESITVYITGQAKELKTGRKEITNTPTISTGVIDKLAANSITHTIIGTNAEIDDPDNPEGSKSKYQISGLAWLDNNKDGKRDEGEELLPNINVLLLDSKTNAIITRTTTGQNGVYTFEGISSGSYLIAFEYDTLNYDVTKYQAASVDASLNSDAVTLTLNLDNTSKQYAVTDKLNLISNMYNIDLGLVKSQKFDLELTKGISLMQVSNAKGTITSSYDNVEIAKVEIPGNQMNGSVVAITYCITVKNTGAVPGYAKKIVDYIPRDLKFNAEMNPDWYQDTDGNLYTQSLANVLINPGEEKTINLILTKTMTDENTGLITNTAEIYEASNDFGIEDMDSTVANRGTNEDDYGLADALVTVKTGGVVLYGGITLLVVAIFAVGTYIIKKKVLTRV